MKWGRRKGSTKELSPRKAKKVEILDQQTNILNKELRSLQNSKKNVKGVRKLAVNRQIKKMTKEKNRLSADSEAIKNGKLTSTQKGYVGAAAVGVGILLAPDILVGANRSMHRIADSRRKRDYGRAAANRLSDSRGLNNFRTIDLQQGADGQWR